MTIGDGHDLQSKRFAGDATLEACYDNEISISIGISSPAIHKIQQALLDAGFSLPSGADGEFGEETEIAVKSYQEARGLNADGLIEASTIGCMDCEFLEQPPEDSDSSSVFQLSNDGFNFIVRHEGLRTQMYNDQAGHCTIGVGHLIHHGNCDGSASENSYKDGITEDQVYDLFRQDLNIYEESVKSNVVVPLTQYQYDALVSFTFNIGTDRFKSSSALMELNHGNYDIVPSKMMLWNKVSNPNNPNKLIVSPGLVTRRADEGILFATGKY